MSEFIQLHVIAVYPPSNLNRDEMGRPKTAILGGTQRLRISSQSLKRAWRESEFFQKALADHMGIRTKRMGLKVLEALKSGRTLKDVLTEADAPAANPPVSDAKAMEWANTIARVFGALKKVEKKEIPEVEQLVHYSPQEINAIDRLISKLAHKGKDPTDKDLDLLTNEHSAVDIAMFGRFLAEKTTYITEAAVQVSHAITVHDVMVEDDYFTAVDDLNRGGEALGAGHIGEAEFGAGVFYTYLCINRDLFRENVQGNDDLTNRAVRALTEAVAKIPPGGKQASFASRAYASYILAERGSQQPRSLAVAFLKPVEGKDLLGNAISALRQTRDKMDTVYGRCYDACMELNAPAGEGSLAQVLDFVSGSHA